MKQIRCSELPRLAHCLGSLGADYTAVNEENEAATEGSLIHAQIAHWIKTGEEPDDGQPTYRTFKMFQRVLTDSDYAPRFDLKDGNVEQSMKAAWLSGHPDLWGYSAANECADLYDWKAGWNTESDHVEQLKGYALLLTYQFSGIKSVRATIIRRDCTAQMWEWTSKELQKWARDFEVKAESWDGRSFVTGEHCQYCPRRFDCPAKQTIVKSAVSAFMADELVFDLTSPATCIALWRMSGEVEKAVKQVRDSIKLQLDAAGPDGMTANGERIYVAPSNKRVIDPTFAWGILEEEVAEDDLSQIVDVKITRLEEALKARAERGQKQQNVDRVMARLAGCGGLKTEPGSGRVTIKRAN